MDNPSDPLARRLVFLGKAISERFGRALAEHDCTVPTWAVLRFAYLNPGLSQVQLANLIGVEGPSLTRQLDKLCLDGLVERRRDDNDRRVIRITLTPAGERRYDELRHVAEVHEQGLLKSLTQHQTTVLGQAISIIHRALEDAHDAVHADR